MPDRQPIDLRPRGVAGVLGQAVVLYRGSLEPLWAALIALAFVTQALGVLLTLATTPAYAFVRDGVI